MWFPSSSSSKNFSSTSRSKTGLSMSRTSVTTSSRSRRIGCSRSIPEVRTRAPLTVPSWTSHSSFLSHKMGENHDIYSENYYYYFGKWMDQEKNFRVLTIVMILNKFIKTVWISSLHFWFLILRTTSRLRNLAFATRFHRP